MSDAHSATGQPAKRRRKKRRSTREEYVQYVVQVQAWDFHYWLRPSDPKLHWQEGAYTELATLDLVGPVIRPEPCKFARAEVTLSAREGMLSETEPRSGLGSLTASGDDKLAAYVFVPMERLPSLTAIAQSARVQIVHFTATTLRYRRAGIISISLDTRFDEENW